MTKTTKRKKFILQQLVLSPKAEGETNRQALKRSLKHAQGLDPTYRLPERVKRVPLRIKKTREKATQPKG